MLKQLFLLVVILFISCGKEEIIPAEPKFENQIELITSYGGTKNETAISVIATTDGGYVITGFTQSVDLDFANKQNEGYDFFVSKFTSDNNLVWQKTYGGTSDDRPNQIMLTNDGGFVVLGSSKSTDGDVSVNKGDRDFWLVKLNANGNLLWEKSFGYQGKDFGTSLIQTNDGGFLVAGELDVTSSNGEGNTSARNAHHAGGDYWLLKLSDSGSVDWSKYYGGNFTDTPHGIVQLSDGGFIIAGTSDSFDVDITANLGTYDFWVIRVTASGSLVWEKNFGGSQIDESYGIVSTDDGNFLIAGNTRSFDENVTTNNGGADLWLVKINPDGALIWEKTYGGSSFDVARSIKKTTDGGFIISGSSRSLDNEFVNKGQNDGWLLKVNAQGEKEWQHFVGGTEIDFFYDAVELTNKDIIAVGETSSQDEDITENKGFTDILIFKLN